MRPVPIRANSAFQPMLRQDLGVALGADVE